MKSLLIILLVTLASCQPGRKDLTITSIYPEAPIIDISGVSDYSEIISILETFDCSSGHHLLKFHDNFIPIQLGIYCLRGGNFVDFKERNIFKVKDSTDFSKKDINTFVLNNGEYPNLSESPQEAIIAMNFSNSLKTEELIAKMQIVNDAYKTIWTKQAHIIFDKHLTELSEKELTDLTFDIYPYQTAILPPR